MDEACIPGTGPLMNKELALRRPGAEVIQRSMYSGYLKLHGLKVLTIVFPNGIIASLCGPVSARENDIALLNMSWLNERLIALQPEIAERRTNVESFFFFFVKNFRTSCALCMNMRPLWEESCHHG